MKIKKDIYHVIFFDLLFELIIIYFVTLGFFLGFQVTKNNFLIYLLIIGINILMGIIIYYLYSLFCKTYYEFTNNSIKITRKEKIIKEINYNKISYCEYHRFVTLLLGNPKGGKLIVYYLEDDVEKYIEVSFSRKLTKKVMINYILIK